MGLLDELLGKAMHMNRGTVIGTVGGIAANTLMSRKRRRWEKSRGDSIEAILEQMTAYDTGRGAGRLLAGWMKSRQAELDAEAAESVFRKLLSAMDKEDGSVEDRARNRFVLSKALYSLEGFRMQKCRYEQLQLEAWDLARKNPKWRKLTRYEVFRGKPFEAESIIGATHRILLELSSQNDLQAFLAGFLENGPLRDDADYYARLIAMTLIVDLDQANADERLMAAIYQWFAEFRDYKIAQTCREEATLTTGLAAATGGLPGMVAMSLLGRAARRILEKRGSR